MGNVSLACCRVQDVLVLGPPNFDVCEPVSHTAISGIKSCIKINLSFRGTGSREFADPCGSAWICSSWLNKGPQDQASIVADAVIATYVFYNPTSISIHGDTIQLRDTKFRASHGWHRRAGAPGRHAPEDNQFSSKMIHTKCKPSHIIYPPAECPFPSIIVVLMETGVSLHEALAHPKAGISPTSYYTQVGPRLAQSRCMHNVVHVRELSGVSSAINIRQVLSFLNFMTMVDPQAALAAHSVTTGERYGQVPSYHSALSPGY